MQPICTLKKYFDYFNKSIFQEYFLNFLPFNKIQVLPTVELVVISSNLTKDHRTKSTQMPIKKACKVNNSIYLRYKQKWDKNYIKIGQDKESGQNVTFEAVARATAK